jgi:hypothetical protein
MICPISIFTHLFVFLNAEILVKYNASYLPRPNCQPIPKSRVPSDDKLMTEYHVEVTRCEIRS